MLQGEKTVIGEDGRVGMTEHTEKPALVPRERFGLGRILVVAVLWSDHTE
jgi:hypothetical protein